MNWRLQRNIFVAFFRSNMLGYGGGPASIPLVHAEVVHRFQWMDDQEFSDILAIGNTLPGPIVTKLAGYIGYRIGGIVGLGNALFAAVMPTVLIMLGLMGVLSVFRDSEVVQGMTAAIVPVVGVMLALLVWSFWKQSSSTLGLPPAISLIAIGAGVIYGLNVHPAIVIGVLLLVAFFWPEKSNNAPPGDADSDGTDSDQLDKGSEGKVSCR